MKFQINQKNKSATGAVKHTDHILCFFTKGRSKREQLCIEYHL